MLEGVETPEDEAERLLDRAWTRLPDRSRAIPVDPIVIAKVLSINVFQGKLPPNVSAKISKEVGADPRIILNQADSPNRKRFSCAHEIGHYIQRGNTDAGFEWTDERGPLATEGIDADEIFANQFAASLLMPRDEVRSLHLNGGRVADLAVTFQVSVDAMQFRLNNLGLSAT